MPKWMQWRMAGEQQMMASVALMSTTAANIALSWLTFIEQAEKVSLLIDARADTEKGGKARDQTPLSAPAGARGDVATKKVIELLSRERICNLVVTRMLESLLAGTRDEMELRVRDMACPIYLGMVADTLAPQRYFADERVAALQALRNRIKS